MILGLLSLLVSNAACLLGAHAIVRRYGTGKTHLDIILFLLLRFVLISLTILLFGLIGILNPLAIGTLGVLALAVLLYSQEHRESWFHPTEKPHNLLIVLLAVLGIRLLLQMWFFSPYTCDALSYHLPKIAEWVRAGAFTGEMGVDVQSSFPAGFELIETWWVVFLHHDALIEFAGIEFLILSFCATFAIARELGLSNSVAWLASLLYSLTPGLHLQATSCLNDGPVAAMMLSTTAIILARLPLSYLLIPLGLGIGIKPTYIYALPGLLALWALLRMRDEEIDPRISHRAMAALGLTALLIGSYWYIHNTYVYGNPIHPVGSKGLIAEEGDRWIQLGPSISSFWRNVTSLVNIRIYDNLAPYGALHRNVSGWGPVSFACGLVATLLALRKLPRLRSLAVAFGISATSVLLLVNHDAFYSRFLLFVPALFCISTAYVVSTMALFLVPLVPALFIQFIGTMAPSELPLHSVLRLSSQDWRERSAEHLFDAQTSARRIGYFSGGHGEAYVLYGPDLSREVVYLRVDSADELLVEMDRTGVDLLFLGHTWHERRSIIDDCIKRGRLRRTSERYCTLIK